MKAKFSDKEKILLRGQGAVIARKHGCSNMYILHIIKGDREIKSPLSKEILKDLKKLIQFLTPKNNQDEKIT